ncbi:MAG: NAD(P)/FAD-dependent oxidoreductase [Bacteroidota bacterium]
MKTIDTSITIIGCGLTGLALANLLNEKGLKTTIIEARNRPGGRIWTHHNKEQAPIEMGATWFGEKHRHINALLAKLNIPSFIQKLGSKAIYEPISTQPHKLVTLPPNSDPSYRIQGGSSRLINRLLENISDHQFYFGQEVKRIEAVNDTLHVSSDTHVFQTGFVISTLPPYLLNAKIQIYPALPDALRQVMNQTHTWMGESIKIGLRFAQPFWREETSSGTLFSNVGPIPELYDHSDETDNYYALKGFLNGAYYSLSKEERLALLLKQLRKYYGKKVDAYIDYQELVWRHEAYTYTPYQQPVLPHQNNGHQRYQEAYMNGKLFIAGAETANTFPGYMEGAIASAQAVFNQLSVQLAH